MNAAEGVTLREHMEAHLRALREYFDAKFQSYVESHRREHEMLALALAEAQRVVEAKLVTMNEVRSQILGERGLFARREDVDAKIDSIFQRIDSLERLQREMLEAKLAPILTEQSNARQNRDAFNGRLAVLIGGAVIILGVFQFLLKYMIQ